MGVEQGRVVARRILPIQPDQLEQHLGRIFQRHAQHRRQCLGRDRLWQEIIHAGALAALALVLQRAGGQRDDWRAPSRAFARPNCLRHSKPIPLRHVAVHQHQRIWHPLQRRERLVAVAGDIARKGQACEHMRRDLLVDRVVVDHQEALAPLLLLLRHVCRVISGEAPPAAGTAARPSTQASALRSWSWRIGLVR